LILKSSATPSSLFGGSGSSGQCARDDTSANLEEVSAVQRGRCGTTLFVIPDVFAIVHLIASEIESALLPTGHDVQPPLFFRGKNSHFTNALI
jgi:hypothetical protein